MAGLDKDTPIPVSLTLHRASRVLELGYDDGRTFRLPFEFLRVLSPSAEVRGHGPGQETLQTGKREVELTGLEPVGNYAVRPVFSDGHDTGIYSWDYLYDLCVRQDALWMEYLGKLAEAGLDRDAPMGAPAGAGGHGHGGGCGHHH
ncbi:hypothetical protein PTE30175_01643 [Pandoraea terrae]|uniref:Gamma-butyrobetaine hydroxylase-like N-terminal domain-containing protein n=1 Tax=Pandoraea terrae TaxID=1537710 RepID=A0A5E4U3I2_9BURK|nr:DUF971 domain-containing protein [Pandoraea terrae]VVD92689.1 hypothetical protein PTE30175_01643 [Pandoraea terrae]